MSAVMTRAGKYLGEKSIQSAPIDMLVAAMRPIVASTIRISKAIGPFSLPMVAICA